MMVRGKQQRVRNGSASVEFAILAPFLFTMLVGVWEMGRVIEVHQLLSNAAREAGRQASTGTYDPSQIQTAARRYLKRAGLSDSAAAAAQVTVSNRTASRDPLTATQLDQFRVTVSLQYSDVRWINLGFLADPNTTLSASADWYSTRDLELQVNTDIPLK